MASFSYLLWFVTGEWRDTTQPCAVRESPGSDQPLSVLCNSTGGIRYLFSSVASHRKYSLKCIMENRSSTSSLQKGWILRTSTQSRVIKMSVLYAAESHFYLKQWNKQNTQCSVCWFRKSKLSQTSGILTLCGPETYVQGIISSASPN